MASQQEASHAVKFVVDIGISFLKGLGSLRDERKKCRGAVVVLSLLAMMQETRSVICHQ